MAALFTESLHAGKSHPSYRSVRSQPRPCWPLNAEATIESNDAMQHNLKEMVVDKSCKQFTVHLKHVGKMAKVAMGHNWC